jgi:hypothetical protein
MKKMGYILCLLIMLTACKNKKNIPDVSEIKVPFTTMRFEKDFFAIDTNHIEASLDGLQKKYGPFLNDFLFNILSLPPAPDSVAVYVKLFIQDYYPRYQTIEQKFASFTNEEKDIQMGLQYVKYYFPEYKLPQHAVTFVGPLEGYGNVLTSTGLAIGLQLYMGKDFPDYHSEYLSNIYPSYQSRRFEPGYIPVNCMTNIFNDIYPPKTGTQTLIEQMIEEGKRIYVLDLFLPETADTLKTGYTANQLQGCYDNESGIWNFFIQNNLLYITDPLQTRDYVNDGPRTEALGPASPGNIGLFVGWQIVKKWMSDHEKNTPEQLLQTPAKQIFEEAKYKPR